MSGWMNEWIDSTSYLKAMKFYSRITVYYMSGGRHGNPLQYSCLENTMDRGALQVIVHRVSKSQTQLKQLSTHLLNGYS